MLLRDTLVTCHFTLSLEFQQLRLISKLGFLVSASLKAYFLLNHLWLTWLILDHL